MPLHLQRIHGKGHSHFVTFSCFDRKPLLNTPHAYRTFETILEQTRQRHNFRVYGYVLMPEHIHLLLSEPKTTPFATVLNVLKTQTSRRLKATDTPFWEDRYHDFNVFTEDKHIEKLRYMHRNPVKRGLTERPHDWPWSTFNHHLTGTPGTVQIESHWTNQHST